MILAVSNRLSSQLVFNPAMRHPRGAVRLQVELGTERALIAAETTVSSRLFGQWLACLRKGLAHPGQGNSPQDNI